MELEVAPQARQAVHIHIILSELCFSTLKLNVDYFQIKNVYMLARPIGFHAFGYPKPEVIRACFGYPNPPEFQSQNPNPPENEKVLPVTALV